MSEPQDKPGEKPKPAEAPVYANEFPRTPQERERAAPVYANDEKAKQEHPDPLDNAAPYGATNRHGTQDSSRYSTPPPKRP